MRNFAHALILLVILGFAANVAVSVFFALRTDPDELTRGEHAEYGDPTPDDSALWKARVDPLGLRDVVFVHTQEKPGLRSRVLSGSDYGVYSVSTFGGKINGVQSMMPADWDRLLNLEVGWPLPAFTGSRLARARPEEWILRASGDPGDIRYEYLDALPINRSGELDWRFMPYRPLPLGFALNWLLYTFVLSIPFGPFWIRRAVRWYRMPVG